MFPDFEIKENIGIISEDNTGWKLELNKVRWRNHPVKYDLRKWSEDHSKMSKGVSLTDDELKALKNIIDYEFIDTSSEKKPLYLKSKSQLVKLLNKYTSHDREYFLIIGIGEITDGQFEVMFIKDITEDYSSLGATFSLRQVFKELLAEDCTGFFAAHNHPIDDVLYPSPDDLTTTNCLTSLGNQLECELIDHIIFDSKLNFYSLAENELLNVPDEEAEEVFKDASCKFIAKKACEKVRKEKRNVQTR